MAFLVGLLSSVLVAGEVSAIIRMITFPDNERHRHFFLPTFAVLYGLVVTIVANVLYEPVASFALWIQGVFPLFSALGLNSIALCMANIVALTMYGAIKWSVITLLRRNALGDRSSMFAPYYGIAYRYIPEEKKWILLDLFGDMGKAISAMYAAALSLAIGSLLLVAIIPNVFPVVIFFPVVLPLAFGEFKAWVVPHVDKEKKDSETDEDDDGDELNLLTMQIKAAQTFPERLLEAHVRRRRGDSNPADVNFIRRLKESDVYEERLAGVYADAVWKATKEWEQDVADRKGKRERVSSLFSSAGLDAKLSIRQDQVEAMVKLLKHENVVFASPFFGDYREFFFFPVNRALMQGDKVLVIDGQGSQISFVLNWLSLGLYSASSVLELWRIEELTLRKPTEGVDVGVLPAHMLNDIAFIESISLFLSEVGFVILLHPALMLGQTQIGMSRLTHLLRDPSSVTYAAFDVNADGLVDSLSHAMRDQFVEMMATPLTSVINGGVLWKAEGHGVHERIFRDVSGYLGFGTELGAFSLREGAEQVEWSAGHSIPLHDIRWVSDQHYEQITTYAQVGCSQAELEMALTMSYGLWHTPITNKGHYIVEDEYCNLLEVKRQYATRATQSAHVNVLSGNYLLRDFMRYNEHMYLGDRRALSLIVADYEQSLRNYLIEVLSVLLYRDVVANEVIARLRAIGIEIDIDHVVPFLVEQISRFDLLPGENNPSEFFVLDRNRTVMDEFGIHEKKVDFVAISSEGTRRRLSTVLSYIACAHYYSEEEEEEGKELGSCMLGMVWQRYLPGQFVTLQGKYYEVMTITPEADLLLRRAGDHFERRLYYRQIKECTIAGCRAFVDPSIGRSYLGQSGIADAPVQARRLARGAMAVTIGLVTADIGVRTLGYLRMTDYGNLAGATFVEVEGDAAAIRKYCQKKALRISFSPCNDQQLLTLALVLNEIAVSLYACDKDYLMVVPALCDDSISTQELRGSVPTLASWEGESGLSGPALYIVEDAQIDIGLVSSFERNTERLLALAEHYLRWHESMLEHGPRLDVNGEHFVSAAHVLGDPELVVDRGPITGRPPTIPNAGDYEVETEFEEGATESDGSQDS